MEGLQMSLFHSRKKERYTKSWAESCPWSRGPNYGHERVEGDGTWPLPVWSKAWGWSRSRCELDQTWLPGSREAAKWSDKKWSISFGHYYTYSGIFRKVKRWHNFTRAQLHGWEA